MPIILSTSGVKEPERFDYWHQWTCQSFSLTDCRRESRDRFEAKASAWNLGPLELCDSVSSCGNAVRFERRTRDIRFDARDHYQFMLVLRGNLFIRQAGREARMAVGDLMMYDQARPFALEFRGASRVIVATIPRPVVTEGLPDAPELTAIRLCGRSKMGR